MEDILKLAYSDGTSEEIWITISKPGWKKIVVGLIYRPPSGRPDPFCQRLEGTLEKLSLELSLELVLNKDLIVLEI